MNRSRSTPTGGRADISEHRAAIQELKPAHIAERDRKLKETQEGAVAAERRATQLEEEAEAAKKKAEAARSEAKYKRKEADELDREILEAIRKEKIEADRRREEREERAAAVALQKEYEEAKRDRAAYKKDQAAGERRDRVQENTSPSQASSSRNPSKPPVPRPSSSGPTVLTRRTTELRPRSRPDIIASFDWNDTVAIPDNGRNNRYAKLHVPEEHNKYLEELLKRGIKLNVVSFAVKRAEEVKADIRSWKLYQQLNHWTVLNQRSGDSFHREFTDHNTGPGYTSGGKDKYLASRGIRLHVDDSEEICSACERQGIYTVRIKTQKEQHPLRRDTSTRHWDFNLGIVEGLPAAIDLIIRELDKDKSKFEVTDPFWNRKLWVKFPYRYQDER